MSIKVKNLTHIYAEGQPYETAALKDVSFEVADGQFAALIGHTGSGKSTLLQHLNGLLKPKEGTIEVQGTVITDPGITMIEVRKRVGLVFQYPEYQLFEETVEKDVAFGPRNLGLSEEEICRRVRESLEATGLNYEELKDKSPFELSGGQKRRVAIAGVLAMKPEVLILDEPTAGLDPKSRNDILNMIWDYQRSQNNIVILASHNMDDVARMADYVLVMDRGTMAMCGTPEEVFSQDEKLEEVGLDIPNTARLMRDLKNAGLDVNKNVFTIDDAEAELVRMLRKR